MHPGITINDLIEYYQTRIDQLEALKGSKSLDREYRTTAISIYSAFIKNLKQLKEYEG